MAVVPVLAAAGDDHVLLPTDEADLTVRGTLDQVAGTEPTVLQDGSCLLGVAPVFAKQQWCADQHFTIMRDLDLEAWVREFSTNISRARKRLAEMSNGAADCFGEAIAFAEIQPPDLPQRDDVLGHRGRG